MKFREGDRVRIKKWRVRPQHWNSMGHMDRWRGEIVTIKKIGRLSYKCSDKYFINLWEDRDPTGVKDGWSWRESDFEFEYENVELLSEDLFEI